MFFYVTEVPNIADQAPKMIYHGTPDSPILPMLKLCTFKSLFLRKKFKLGAEIFTGYL